MKNVYQVEIKTRTTYSITVGADDELLAIVEAFENRYAWRDEYDEAYEVNVKKVEQ